MVDAAEKIMVGLNSRDIELFKKFREHQEQIEKIIESGLLSVLVSSNWKELYDYAGKLQFGTLELIIKEGLPVKIDKPMQQLILGQKHGKH